MNIVTRIYYSLCFRFNRICYHLYIKPHGRKIFDNWDKPKVYTIEETLNHIIEHKSSICRLGDGEFNLIFGVDLGFQKCSPDISKRMKTVLQSHESNILIGIPDVFDNLNAYPIYTVNWWHEYLYTNASALKHILGERKTYYNTQISRFADYKCDKTETVIPLYRKIWDKRDVYLVEGEQTRVGVGNNLLDNAANVYRILAPTKNAYDAYDNIMKSVKIHAPEGALVIIALGPTATILAYDLAKMGYQALDLGHFDIQYECHLRGISCKEPIPGKYVNEAAEAGQTVDDSAITDFRYKTSIIDIIRNE